MYKCQTNMYFENKRTFKFSNVTQKSSCWHCAHVGRCRCCCRCRSLPAYSFLFKIDALSRRTTHYPPCTSLAANISLSAPECHTPSTSLLWRRLQSRRALTGRHPCRPYSRLLIGLFSIHSFCRILLFFFLDDAFDQAEVY